MRLVIYFRRKKKNIQVEIPEVNHNEVATRALTIFRFGMISKVSLIVDQIMNSFILSPHSLIGGIFNDC